MIQAVRGMIDIPLLIVGGGLNTPEKKGSSGPRSRELEYYHSGNAFEDKPIFLEEVSRFFEKYKQAFVYLKLEKLI